MHPFIKWCKQSFNKWMFILCNYINTYLHNYIFFTTCSILIFSRCLPCGSEQPFKVFLFHYYSLMKLKRKNPLITVKLYDPITQFERYPLQRLNNGDFYWFFCQNWKGSFGEFDTKQLYQWNKYPFTDQTRIQRMELEKPVFFSDLFWPISRYVN